MKTKRKKVPVQRNYLVVLFKAYHAALQEAIPERADSFRSIFVRLWLVEPADGRWVSLKFTPGDIRNAQSSSLDDEKLSVAAMAKLHLPDPKEFFGPGAVIEAPPVKIGDGFTVVVYKKDFPAAVRRLGKQAAAWARRFKKIDDRYSRAYTKHSELKEQRKNTQAKRVKLSVVALEKERQLLFKKVGSSKYAEGVAQHLGFDSEFEKVIWKTGSAVELKAVMRSLTETFIGWHDKIGRAPS